MGCHAALWDFARLINTHTHLHQCSTRLHPADGGWGAAQWAHGYHIQFGLYAWSPGDGAKRTQRAATPSLAAIYKDLPARLARAHELAVGEKPYKKANGVAATNGTGSPHSVLDVKPLDMARQGSDTNV